VSQRVPGIGVDELFPLPLREISRLPASGRGRLRVRLRRPILEWTNVVLATLNVQHAGGEAYCLNAPSAAQSRMLCRVEGDVQAFLREAFTLKVEAVGGEASLKEFVHLTLASYDRFGYIMPLDARAGVPDSAARVDTESVLRRHYPHLADCAHDPSQVLFDSTGMPASLPRPFIRVGKDYDLLVSRFLSVGLQEMRSKKRVVHFSGKPVYAGVFSVGKEGKAETRMISAATSANAMVDPEKMPRPRFPNIAQLGVLRLRGPGRLRVSKRDIRHFFHQLRNSSKWRGYLAHPRPQHVRKSLKHVIRPGYFPVHRSWPMGHALSATLAQGVMDSCGEDADLPADARVRHGDQPPARLPVYGLCMDDGWAVDQEDDYDALVTGDQMLVDLVDAWERVGLEENVDKHIADAFGEEIQGFFVHPVDKWVGLSVGKRIKLWGSGLLLLGMQRPARHSLDRWLGKVGYAFQARSSCRAVFDVFYTRMAAARDAKQPRIVWDQVLFDEAMAAVALLPLAQFSLAAPFSTRVVASDASPGGHGLSYGHVSEDTVASWARMSVFKGDYATLLDDIHLVPVDHRPLRRVQLDLSGIRWKHVGRPGGWRFIHLEETHALRWGVSSRGRFAGEVGARVVHLVDSATAVGSAVRGRSSSRQLNAELRKLSALVLALGLFPFYIWLASGENPSDWPSGWFGLRATLPLSMQLPKGSKDLCEMFIILICPEINEVSSLHDALLSYLTCTGYKLRVLTYGVTPNPDYDIRRLENWKSIANLIRLNRVAILYMRPSHSTFSTWAYFDGRRGLRDFSYPFGVPGLAPRDRQRCDVQTVTVLRCVRLAEALGTCGVSVMENPHHDHRPTIFMLPSVRSLIAQPYCHDVIADHIDQKGIVVNRYRCVGHFPTAEHIGPVRSQIGSVDQFGVHGHLPRPHLLDVQLASALTDALALLTDGCDRDRVSARSRRVAGAAA